MAAAVAASPGPVPAPTPSGSGKPPEAPGVAAAAESPVAADWQAIAPGTGPGRPRHRAGHGAAHPGTGTGPAPAPPPARSTAVSAGRCRAKRPPAGDRGRQPRLRSNRRARRLPADRWLSARSWPPRRAVGAGPRPPPHEHQAAMDALDHIDPALHHAVDERQMAWLILLIDRGNSAVFRPADGGRKAVVG